VYLYTRVYTYESTCSAPRHGAYPGPRRARVRVPDIPPASGGGRARHRPPAAATSPRTPTGRYPPTTRKTTAAARAGSALAPPGHRRTTNRNTTPGGRVRPWRYTRPFLKLSFQLLFFFFHFRSIVFAQGTSAAAPAPESFLVIVCIFLLPFLHSLLGQASLSTTLRLV
jgi:hypothetical protein